MVPDIDKVLRATSVIHIGQAHGNAVAITRKLALTALHAHGKLDAAVSLTTTIGGRTLPGVDVYYKFAADLVDIAVIQLTNEGDHFPDFIGVHFNKIKLADPIFVVGLKVDARDEAAEAVYPCNVNVIEKGEHSAMFQSDYASFDGLSGAGVVTRVVNGVTKVVGVHVGSHDATVKHPKIKSSGRELTKRINLALDSVASSIHGHHAFCLACEVARVPDLVDFLRDRGLH